MMRSCPGSWSEKGLPKKCRSKNSRGCLWDTGCLFPVSEVYCENQTCTDTSCIVLHGHLKWRYLKWSPWCWGWNTEFSRICERHWPCCIWSGIQTTSKSSQVCWPNISTLLKLRYESNSLFCHVLDVGTEKLGHLPPIPCRLACSHPWQIYSSLNSASSSCLPEYHLFWQKDASLQQHVIKPFIRLGLVTLCQWQRNPETEKFSQKSKSFVVNWILLTVSKNFCKGTLICVRQCGCGCAIRWATQQRCSRCGRTAEYAEYGRGRGMCTWLASLSNNADHSWSRLPTFHHWIKYSATLSATHFFWWFSCIVVLRDRIAKLKWVFFCPCRHHLCRENVAFWRPHSIAIMVLQTLVEWLHFSIS